MGHDLQTLAAHQPEQRAVGLGTQEVLADAGLVLRSHTGSGRVGVGPVDPDRGLHLRPCPLGEPRVVAVRVGEQNGVQILERATERPHSLLERLPVTGCTRVDQREFPHVLDEVEVHDTLCQPMDAVRDLPILHRRLP